MSNGKQPLHVAENRLRDNGSRHTRRFRILVVDDDEAIVSTLRLILRNVGYEVEVAHDGNQAVDVAARFYPNLLLSDVIMPGKDGVEAAMEIRKMLPDCAVLLISGSTQVVDSMAKARAQWVNFELMAKPVHPSELIRRIEQLCSPSPQEKAG
jgi:CheY-like chemotaxis protein